MAAGAKCVAVWVKCKRTPLYDSNGEDRKLIRYAPFGERFEVLKKDMKQDGGLVRGLKRSWDGSKKVASFFWIPLRAVTTKRVENYARLYYLNLNRNGIPVSAKYQSRKVIGRIAPGERISVIARVGDWCLTAKGWTLFKWLTKERDVFDSKALRDVYGAALSQAAKDYCRCIRHLRRLKKGDEDRFHDLMYQLDTLVGWFLSDDYLAVFDTVPGNERLDKMNEQLGVDKDWLRELCRIYEEMDRKKPHRRVVYRK